MGDFHQEPYDMPRVLVTAEGEVWQTSENFHGSADTTLSENINESYMTADGDNTTQYFSVLETSSETILNDMSQISLDETRVVEDYILDGAEESETVAVEATDEQQLMLFQMEGSDEYYGMQVAEDADGNLQKYQFQLRQTEDGQYETIPGSIQIVPMDSEVVQEKELEETAAVTEDSAVVETNVKNTIYVKQEYLNESSNDAESAQGEEAVQAEHDIQQEDEFIEEELHIHVTGDTKEGIIEKALQQAHSAVYETNYVVEEEIEQPNQPNESSDAVASEVTEFITTKPGNVKEELVAYEQLYFQESDEENCDINEHCQIEEVMLQEDHDNIQAGMDMYFSESPDSVTESMDSQHSNMMGHYVEHDDDDDDFDEDDWRSDDEEGFIPVRAHQQFSVNSNNRLEMVNQLVDRLNGTPLKNNNKGNKTKERSLYSIVLNDPEKENVEEKLPKKTTPKLILNPKARTPEKPPVVVDKRFQKGKDAVQARRLHNYISQTTILQAPVRQERLPRKQKINPVIRADENIVVQEVKVSNGYIEISEDGVLQERKQIVPTECIQLSDSDENEDLTKKRKRKSKKQVEIIISDSEEETVQEAQINVTPKTIHKVTPQEVTTKETPQVGNGTLERKKETKCSKCPKTFPSLGSFRTHMQFHTYEEANKTKAAQSSQQKDTLKHKCAICGDPFKNTILLKRHIDSHKLAKFECAICKRIFSDITQLATHKRSHVKEHMFKTTTSDIVSPKKQKQPFKRPAPKPETFKCTVCARLFPTALLLSSHSKSHKRLTCLSCSTTFASRLLLDEHRLRNCVKSPGIKKRTSFIPPRKTDVRSTSKSINSRLSVQPTSKIPVTPIMQVKCDDCPAILPSYKKLLEHKVNKHNYVTPDTSVGKSNVRKSLYRPCGAHSGVPASLKFRKAFAAFKSKLEGMQKE